jgi:hypothetical protein
MDDNGMALPSARPPTVSWEGRASGTQWGKPLVDSTFTLALVT